MQKIIIILGATATKKTTLAKMIANDFNCAIINADSFQVYSQLNVGINKPSKQDLMQYDFHLINCCSIYDDFDIAIYQKWCNQKINELANKNKHIILCGGSNLYIDALIYNYQLENIASREQIRYFNDWPYDSIYDYVLKHDPHEAYKIGFNNKRRIIRAAQIIYATNKPKSEIQPKHKTPIYDFLMIETTTDKEVLYERINKRVDQMINNGWYHEVSTLYQNDPNIINLQALKALGYPQIINAILNQTDIDVELIKQKTRNYAKKQLTWIRNHYPNRIQFDVNNDNYEQLKAQIQQFYLK